MGRQGKRRRIAKGIYVDGRGHECMVMVAGQKRTKRFPLGTGIKVMEEWLFEQRVEIRQLLKTQGTVGPRTGTLAADAARYLAMPDIRSMVSFRDRRRHIDAWVAVLGTRKRSAISADEIQQQLAAWRAEGASASTVNHHRTALRHLFRVLDGKHARNPVADTKKVPEQSEDPKGRALDPLSMARVIARIKLRSLTRVRLALQVTTGVTPVELTRLTRRSFAFGENQSGSVTVPPRHKGKGAPARTVPFMTVHAWRAARAFVHTYDRENAWGVPFSTSSIRKSFLLAAQEVREKYRSRGLDQEAIDLLLRPDARPYDTRHTFGTFVAAATKDDTVAQALLGHRSITTTQRYTRKSVPDRIAAVVASTHKRRRVSKASEATPAAAPGTVLVGTIDMSNPFKGVFIPTS
jgi:site-specific recombinase XerD